MFKVISTADPLEAHMLLSILEDGGIKAVLQGEALWGARGELPFAPSTSPSIWVSTKEDLEAALELLAQRQENARPSHCAHCGYDLRGQTTPRCPECGRPFNLGSTWTCDQCGEKLGAQFTHCWNCGAPRPDAAGRSGG